MIESMQIPVQMYTDALTQPIIAPVQETLTAKQEYGSGAYFIYRSKLYKTTAAIAQGGSIVLEGSGANATPAGTVGEFMTSQAEFDSGWQTLNATYGANYRCKNGVVYIYCKYNGTIAGGTELGTLPIEFRPIDVMIFPNYNAGSFSESICLQIRADNGKVIITGDGTKWINVSGSYPV